MNFTTKNLKRILNLYPPYLGAGIRVEYIREDWKELLVSMKMHWYNRNAVGTHFGGSLYSKVDPHLMLLLMNLLGKQYIVWDKSSNIEFIKATKNKVNCLIKITDDEINIIKQKTENGNKFLPKFNLEIKDDENKLIARVQKILYVRKNNEFCNKKEVKFEKI